MSASKGKADIAKPMGVRDLWVHALGHKAVVVNALNQEIQTGTYLTPQQRWDVVTNIPECVEHNRLCNLQGVHLAEMETIVKQMWATPALTPEGRRAKVLVALNMLPGEWRDCEADYGISEARQLLIEFVGGEPGQQLREQFSDQA